MAIKRAPRKEAIKVGANAAFTLTTAVEAKVTFDTVIWKFGVWDFNSTVANGIVLPRAGLARISFQVQFTANATGRRFCRVNSTNPTFTDLLDDQRAAVTTDNTEASNQDLFVVSAGQQLVLNAFQSSGGNLTLVTGATANDGAANKVCMTVEYVDPFDF